MRRIYTFLINFMWKISALWCVTVVMSVSAFVTIMYSMDSIAEMGCIIYPRMQDIEGQFAMLIVLLVVMLFILFKKYRAAFFFFTLGICIFGSGLLLTSNLYWLQARKDSHFPYDRTYDFVCGDRGFDYLQYADNKTGKNTKSNTQTGGVMIKHVEDLR